jgi:hypothetical protein
MHKCLCSAPGHCQWHGTVTTAEEFQACRNGSPPAVTAYKPCIYLAEELKDRIDGQLSYACRMHGKCTLLANNVAQPACADCKDRLTLDSPDLAAKFLDPLTVTDCHKTPTHALRGILAGGPAFLVCGGPSVKLIDYMQLNGRGIFSLGVNNVAGMVPVNAFTCSDPPMKFHWGIFLDPRIMKFLPVPKLGGGKNRGQLRRKNPDGTFQWIGRCAKDCPNVWGYERRSWMMPDHTFFTEPHAAWGNQQAGVDRCDQPKTACTMLLGFRLLHYLGARMVFILGADFEMLPEDDVGLDGNYAFGQARGHHCKKCGYVKPKVDGKCSVCGGNLDDSIASNNRQYRIANDWLVQLRPVFERFGMQCFNCNPLSGLRAFDYAPFDDALRICKGSMPAEPYDLASWYEKDATLPAEETK